MKFGCCGCAAGTGAWPNDVEPPELPPLPLPLLALGEAHGSPPGDGVPVPTGLDGGVLVGVGVAPGAAPRSARCAAVVGLPLGSGTGSELDEADGVAEPEGDALLSTPQSVLTTGFGAGDELDEGDVVDEGRVGRPDGLCEGRADGFGPASSPAKAVAATEPNTATAATLTATDFEGTANFRVIRETSVTRSPPRSTFSKTDKPRETPTRTLAEPLRPQK